MSEKRRQKRKDRGQDEEIKKLKEKVEKSEKDERDDRERKRRKDGERRGRDRGDEVDVRREFKTSGDLVLREYEEGRRRLGDRFAIGDGEFSIYLPLLKPHPLTTKHTFPFPYFPPPSFPFSFMKNYGSVQLTRNIEKQSYPKTNSKPN